MPLASILGAATSLAGSIVGANQSKKSQRRQNEWQSQENQKTRDFNSQEAQKSRDYQTQMYYIDRAYNSAKNQARLYSEAGLNPSLMMSQGAGSMSGQTISSPSASASAGGAPSMDNSGSLLAGGIGQVGNIISQTPLQKAQVDNLNADSSNLNEKTKGEELENVYRSIRNDGAVQMRDLTITGLDLANKLSEKESWKLTSEIDAISQSITESKKRIEKADAEIANLNVDEQTKILDNYMKSCGFSPQLAQQLKDTCGFTDDDIKGLEQVTKLNFLTSQAQLGNIAAQTYLLSEQGQWYRTNRVQINWERSHGVWAINAKLLKQTLINSGWTGEGIKLDNAGKESENKIKEFQSKEWVQMLGLGLRVADTAGNLYGTAADTYLTNKRLGRNPSSTGYASSFTPFAY